ncbi:MAG: right-handed parallel beta-helix repeat-containing protein [Deltaproteobacteria bacterium]|nr:right-handed parallel beta-helix repeat-containing protein [Deltaproteobacteria bacterium]
MTERTMALLLACACFATAAGCRAASSASPVGSNVDAAAPPTPDPQLDPSPNPDPNVCTVPGTGACTSAPAAIPCPDPVLGATVYYVCDCGAGADPNCVPGDDAAAGTSAAAPWRSYSRARQAFGGLPAGGTIAFCRGGSFDATGASSRRWVATACRADAPCTVRAYAPAWGGGNEPRPILHAGGENLFALEDSGEPDTEAGFVFLDLDLRGDGGGWAFFLYNDVDDVMLCNLAISQFEIGVHVGGANAGGTGDGKNERVTLRNSEVTGNAGQGWLGSCSGCAIEYSRFDNNGFAQAVFSHNIYLSGSNGAYAIGERVVGNTLSRSAFVGGACQGVSLVVHGRHRGLLVEGNTVFEDPGTAGDGCWGIAVDPGYSEAEGFEDVVITRNVVRDVGNIGIGVAACARCTIENNVVIKNTSGVGIAAPDRARGVDDLAQDAVVVRNNSIFLGMDGTGIRLNADGAGHHAVSNAILAPGGACFDADLAPGAYAMFDYNVCQAGVWEEAAGALTAWQAATGHDAHSLSADPGFASTVAPVDLSSASASSAIVDHGHPSASAPLTAIGAARSSPPDAGAHER